MEAQMEFVNPGKRMAQTWLVWTFGGGGAVRRHKENFYFLSPSVSLSLQKDAILNSMGRACRAKPLLHCPILGDER